MSEVWYLLKSFLGCWAWPNDPCPSPFGPLHRYGCSPWLELAPPLSNLWLERGIKEKKKSIKRNENKYKMIREMNTINIFNSRTFTACHMLANTHDEVNWKIKGWGWMEGLNFPPDILEVWNLELNLNLFKVIGQISYGKDIAYRKF